MKTFFEKLSGKEIGYWVLAFLHFGALIFFGWMAFEKGKTLDNVSIIIGAIITNLGLLLNFRFGSSKGSKDKQELLNKQQTSDNGKGDAA